MQEKDDPEKKKDDPDCNLKTTYIYQMSNNRIMIVPKNTPLSDTLYIKKQKPQLEFNATELEKLESLDGYYLSIQGLTNTKQIPLKDLFKYKEDSMTWIWILTGIFIFITLVGIFALVLYKNWGADDEEQVVEKKDDKKPRKKRNKDDVQFGSFTSDKTSPGSGLKQSLLSKEKSTAQ